MKDIAVNADGTVTVSTIQLTADLPEYVAQKLTRALRMFKGEWYLNPAIGVDYLAAMEKNPDLELMGAQMKTTILSVSGVSEINEFQLYLESTTRQARADFRVTLTDGSILDGEV